MEFTHYDSWLLAACTPMTACQKSHELITCMESIASILSEQGFLAHVLDCKVCFKDQGIDDLRLALYYLS